MTQTSALRLGSDVMAARQAREFVRRCLQPWVGDELLDDALVVASELVTNAVMHAGTTSELVVRVDPDLVELRLSDGDPRTPRRRTLVGGLPAQGRGLVVLSSLSERWGVDERADGKTVWAVLRAS